MVFNVFHKMSEKPDVKCPKCDAKSLRQLSVNSNIIFKWEGFYVNDYKKKEGKKKSDSTETLLNHKCKDSCFCKS